MAFSIAVFDSLSFGSTQSRMGGSCWHLNPMSRISSVARTGNRLNAFSDTDDMMTRWGQVNAAPSLPSRAMLCGCFCGEAEVHRAAAYLCNVGEVRRSSVAEGGWTVTKTLTKKYRLGVSFSESHAAGLRYKFNKVEKLKKLPKGLQSEYP